MSPGSSRSSPTSTLLCDRAAPRRCDGPLRTAHSRTNVPYVDAGDGGSVVLPVGRDGSRERVRHRLTGQPLFGAAVARVRRLRFVAALPLPLACSTPRT